MVSARAVSAKTSPAARTPSTIQLDEDLREEERIAFHAGDHRTAIEMSFSDFERLADPIPAAIAGPPRERV